MDFRPTEQQQAVIAHDEGPLLVIAGPGSGKTFTLVERIVHLVVNKGVQPEQLLVATFTEKAAKEIVSRITRRLMQEGVTVNVDEMYIGTLHSICLRLLEEHREFTRLKKNFTVMDQFDQSYFFFQHLNEFEELAPVTLLLKEEKETSRWNKANLLCRWMNKLSEEMLSADALMADPDEAIQALGKWNAHYQKLLEQENLLDFSVIQLEAYRLLTQNPDTVLAPLKEKIRYVMVDEYQDTNTIQERLLFSLLDEKQNICVVGDDDQGLYRFRGATIRNILEFAEHFPKGKCAVHSLTVNYRSDPGIIDFYNGWMDGSVDDFSWEGEGGKHFRHPKQIEPPTGKPALDTPVLRVSGSADEQNWHEEVLDFLQTLKAKHLSDWNQVAFLFRSVRSDKAKALASYLEEHGIPIYAPRSDLYFEREEVRLMLGAFLFIFRIFKEVREKWEAKYRPLGVWEFYDSCLRQFGARLRQPENKELKDWCVRRFNEIEGMLSRNKPLDFGFSALFYQLIQFPLFSDFLELGTSARDERPARNLAIFSQLLVKFEYLHHIQVLHPDYLEKNVGDLFNHFFRYIKDGGITEFEDPDDTTPGGAVPFMTIHQAKGLEFPVTIVGSLNASPRKNYSDLDEALEARHHERPPFEPLERMKDFDFKRLYYTAFSRAKNLLVLTCQEKRTKRGKLSAPTEYFHKFYTPLPDWRAADLSALKVDAVQPAGIKGRYSYTSHVLLYEGCPRQYQFFKYWEFSPVREGPMLFGQLVHQTIEDIHKAVLREQPESVTEDNIRLWFDVNYANLSHKERVYLAPQIREVALGHVLRYVERKHGNWADIRGTEVDVSLVRDEYILTGKIDLIQGKGDTVEIVDFKATPKPDQYAERHILDRYRRQLEIYAFLVEQRHGLEVSAMNLYYTGETAGVPTYRFPFDGKSVDKTIADVDAVVGCMERREFAVTERPAKLCKECDLQAFCNRSL
ncbi:MAG: ATP-dependent helicase [Desulfovibrio sp.]|nr:ATP-dependent helicase [Desulfovibrio sp.]